MQLIVSSTRHPLRHAPGSPCGRKHYCSPRPAHLAAATVGNVTLLVAGHMDGALPAAIAAMFPIIKRTSKYKVRGTGLYLLTQSLLRI